MNLWVWKNGPGQFVAYDEEYPCYENGDPKTLGEPIGVATLQPYTKSPASVAAYAALRTPAATTAGVEEIADLREKNAELEALFDLQHKRMGEATLRWRAAHPGKELTSPDLGALLTWLMSEIDGYKLSLAMSVGGYRAADASKAAAEVEESTPWKCPMCNASVQSNWTHCPWCAAVLPDIPDSELIARAEAAADASKALTLTEEERRDIRVIESGMVGENGIVVSDLRKTVTCLLAIIRRLSASTADSTREGW